MIERKELIRAITSGNSFPQSNCPARMDNIDYCPACYWFRDCLEIPQKSVTTQLPAKFEPACSRLLK